MVSRLETLHDNMVASTSSGDSNSSPGPGITDNKTHQLARHKAILQDVQLEYRRVRANLDAARDTAELLAGSHLSPGVGFDDVEGRGPSSQLLRERAVIASTSAAIDGVIGQAQSIAGGLMDQRGLLGGVGKKIAHTGQRIPLINSVIQAIRRKKSKDTLILSAVAAVCIVFLVVYASTKS